MGKKTEIVHAGWDPYAAADLAVNPPIQLSSTFAQHEPGQPVHFEYARSDNPTRAVLEAALAELEGGTSACAFASGLAAIDAVVRSFTTSGDVVVAHDDAYGGTLRLLRHGFAQYGVTVVTVDMTDAAAVAQTLRDVDGPVRLLWCETPSNPTLDVVDLSAVGRVAKSAGALLVVDNTFATPYLQQPLAFGADLVVHSSTKYLGGHSDVVGGAVVGADADLMGKVRWVQNAAGAVAAPFDAYLTLRGIRTLALRMDQSQQTAGTLARKLHGSPHVKTVWYPGLPTHPNRRVAVAQMSGAGAMLSFEPVGGLDRTRQLVAKLSLFTLAESLGAVESLVCVPVLMTHASLGGTQKFPAGLVRLSVGIEDADDLWADLVGALDATA